MTMQNPFGQAFGNAGLTLPDPNAPVLPKPMKLLTPEESEAAGLEALRTSTVSPIALSTGGTLPPTVVQAAKERAALAAAPTPAPVPYAAAGPEQQHSLPPATVAKAKARAAGGGAPKGPSLQQQTIDAMTASNAADVAGVRAQQTHQAMLGDLLDQQRDQAEQRMVERQARQAERDRHIDQQMGQLSQDVEAVKNIRFDANRVFASPAGILGAAASAMRAGANERIMGRNLAEDALRDAISRDFEEQKANAAQKSTALGAKQNFITMMRQNYADRNQADAAAEIAHKEAAIQQIQALAAHSKVPEYQAQVDKLIAGLDGDVVKLKTQWQAQAAAAAGAAEQERWRRYQWEREQQRKEAETASTIDKNRGEGGKDVNNETRQLAEQLNTSKVPQARQTIDRARAAVDEGATVTNMNPLSNKIAESAPLIYSVLAGDKGADAQQAFAAARNMIYNLRSGGAINDSEAARLGAEADAAGTPRARRLFLENFAEVLKATEANLRSGFSDRANQTYDSRLGGRQPTTTTSAPTGFIPGGGQ